MTRRALVVGLDYRPLKIISAEKAVSHYLMDKLDVVEYSDVVYRSPSISVIVPSVLRAKKWVDLPERERSILLITKNVLQRDEYRCGYCGKTADTVDHIVPRSRGGKHIWENVVACCRKDNQRKGDKLLDELGWTLRVTPYRPVRRWTTKPTPAWLPYLGEAEAVA